MNEKKNKILCQVRCPVCGYKMPLFYHDRAECTGVTITCKGRNCHAVFELNIKEGKQIR